MPTESQLMIVEPNDLSMAVETDAGAPSAIPTEPTAPSKADRFYDLLSDLEKNVPQVDLRTMGGSSQEIASLTKSHRRIGSQTEREELEMGSDQRLPEKLALLQLVSHSPDLAGLPFRDETASRTDRRAVMCRVDISSAVRAAQSRQESPPSAAHVVISESRLTGLLTQKSGSWRRPDAVSTLVQMLQVENICVRLKLVEILSSIAGSEASEALAERALFDLAGTVREEAVACLGHRPREEFRRRLFAGFRYPWPPVARHAAEALVQLEDRDSVSDLIGLLDEPDPAAPIKNEEGTWMKSELVRVNHLRNCLLCHPRSSEPHSLLRGSVPTPGIPLPETIYYQGDPGGVFVRAEVVFLRQDFSAVHLTSQFRPWPDEQRYDYLVRVRKANPEEVQTAAKWTGTAGEACSYPQREAVLLALRKLTGLDAGALAKDWRRVFRTQAD